MKSKLLIIIMLLGFSQLNAQTTQIVDLTTGIDNTTGLPIPVTGFDDTWKWAAIWGSMVGPYNNFLVSNGDLDYLGTTIYHMPKHSCGGWISPSVNTSPGTYWGMMNMYAGTGYYLFKTEFNSFNCTATSATLNISRVGADDKIDTVWVNGYPHSLIPYSIGFSSLTAFTITIPAGEIISGTNSIILKGTNNGNYLGLFMCGNLTINYATDPGLTPSLYGNTNYCGGSAIIFNGSDGPSTATHHYWEIVECNSSGVTAPGGYNWSGWYTGSPGYFSIPGSSTLACDKYYKVKLAVKNDCVNWAEATQIIYVYCPPTVNAGSNQTICEGTCVTLNSGGPIKKHTYVWSVLTDEPYVIGTGGSITVCPTNTTTYCVTGTTVATGCSTTSCVTITVLKTKPDFIAVSTINPSDNFYTTIATPINLAPAVAGIPGFGYAWFVDEIVSPANTTIIPGSSVSNSSCWWNSTLITNFNGYDGPFFTSTNLNPMTGGCSSPIMGHFTAGHTYRITRGTWSDNCPWKQYSVIVYQGHSMSGSGSIITQEDPNAPDYSSFANSSVGSTVFSENNISIFPNPSNGIFSIQLSKAAVGTIEVYDAFGKKVKTIRIAENTSDYKLDLSDYAKGVYMLNMITEGEKISKKIIVE